MTDENSMYIQVAKAKLASKLRARPQVVARLNKLSLKRLDLRDADLSGANLRYANLRDADLSGCKGLLNATQWLNDNFEKTKDGYIVYKAISLHYTPPGNWNIEPNSVIEEPGVNPDRCTECGSGVNFATLKWFNSGAVLWKCLLKWEDLADVVVPFGTDGKARCARLTLIEEVK